MSRVAAARLRWRWSAVLTATLCALSGTTWAVCVGDCSGDSDVTIDELTRMVRIALGTASVSECAAGDSTGDGAVSIDEIVAAVGSALNGCGSSKTVLFGTEGERLNAYDPADNFRKQVVVSGGEDEHAGGLSLNGQICFDPTHPRHMLLADDAGQPEVPPGWVVLQIDGDRVGSFSATKIGRLVPTYQAARDNLGCGFLSDGRALTVDIGNSAGGDATGQLVMWFPPFDVPEPHYCKLDITIGTAGGVWVDAQQRIHVASARVDPGVYRYTGPFPTSDDAAGGCGGHDGTGAPMVEHVMREQVIRADSHARTPNAVVGTQQGTFYVSSAFNGFIAEYGADGAYLRTILRPAPGDKPLPYQTGSPLGLSLDANGTLYYADLGLVISGLNIGPGPGRGTVRRIRFVNGLPQAPDTIDSGLNFPDGVGVLEESTE